MRPLTHLLKQVMWYPLSTTEHRSCVRKALRKSILIGRSNRLNTTMLILTVLLKHFSNVIPDYAPNPEEYDVVIKDTELSLRREFDVNSHVIINSVGNVQVIKLIISQNMNISILIKCDGTYCRFYGDESVRDVQDSVGTYKNLVNKALKELCSVYEVRSPRIVLTPNPTVYGKVLFIDKDELVTLSLWELVRVSRIIKRSSNLGIEDLTEILDTLVHEFVHYVIDLKYPVRDLFVQLTKRIPTVTDDGIIHELVAESVTPAISRVLAEYIVNGKVTTQPSIETLVLAFRKCHVPPRRRYVVIARQIINDLLSQLLNKINR